MTENPNVEPENPNVEPDTPDDENRDWNSDELGSMADYADDTEPDTEE